MAGNEYKHQVIEKKWRDKWQRENLYSSDKKNPKKYYLLVELSYSSGDLHMGHWFAWSGPDVYARMKRMQGYNVLFPVGGFDSFGLPAENAAIKKGIHPKKWIYKNIDTMRKQFRTMGPSFDWDKEVITSDPDYYRWTQWLFLELYKNGLAYRDKVYSNWCPDCKTVLANEHVENGCCWRHTSTKVEQKLVDQWLFRITKYADRLIWPDEIDTSLKRGRRVEDPERSRRIDWPRALREGQNNWIGRSEGIIIKFSISLPRRQAGNFQFSIDVFTTRPDTIYGATFLVLSPEHLFVTQLMSKKEIKDYVEKSSQKSELERKEAREKTGVFTGLYAINPLSKEKMPIWIADYVLAGYGTGAIMGVPAHDERDFKFAQKYNLEIKRVIKAPADYQKEFYEAEGVLTNSGDFSDLASQAAREKISEYIVRNQLGTKSVQYHLRDWTISRQRYWGAPIPIIYCEECGIVPVPEKDLPVLLPENVDYTPTGKPPLATAPEWLKVACPECGGVARREVETMDTYVDSSWYFFRYPTPKYDKGPLDKKVISEWMPIKLYFGGPEHILGHTLYARFITKFLYDLGFIKFDEFALKRIHHGVILGPDGYRMSKSRGNVINPDLEVAKYGADTVRLYLCFLGPHDQGGAWNREGIEGANRFLKRVWSLLREYKDLFLETKEDSKEVLKAQHKTVQKVTKDIESVRFNTAIAAIMQFYNLLKAKTQGKIRRVRGQIRCAEWDEALKTLVKLLAPYAPHMAEELWVEVLGEKFSIHKSPWPKYDPDLAKEDQVVVVVEVDGKVRSQIRIKNEESRIKNKVEKLALGDPKLRKWLEGKKVKNMVFVPGKVANFVTF